MDEKFREGLYRSLQDQFRKQQLAKNAESIRTHHPEFRRHQKAIQDEIKKVEEHFEETIKDDYIAEMVETMLHFQGLGHPTNLYEYPLKLGETDADRRFGYEIHRRSESAGERQARIQRYWEKERAKNPPPEDEDETEDE